MDSDKSERFEGKACSGEAVWRTIVRTLALKPHPEGGYYREVFRSPTYVTTGAHVRSSGTSIYYLLAEGAFSAWHRIDADEVWYFHSGEGIHLHVLYADGRLITHHLADPSHHSGAVFQATVPAGSWFAAELAQADGHALVSCAVMPGFEFSGFELATEADMSDAIQRHGEWLRKLLSATGQQPQS